MILYGQQDPQTLYAGMWDFRRPGLDFRSAAKAPMPSAAAAFSRVRTRNDLDLT